MIIMNNIILIIQEIYDNPFTSFEERTFIDEKLLPAIAQDMFSTKWKYVSMDTLLDIFWTKWVIHTDIIREKILSANYIINE